MTALDGAKSYLRAVLDDQPVPPGLASLWDRFFSDCDGTIRRFATALGVPPSELEDCVQEVWMKLVSILSDFEYDPQRGKFYTWLYTLVRSSASNCHRGRQRRAALELDEQLLGETADAEADPATQLERTDTRQRNAQMVESTLQRLRTQVSSTNYEILRLRYFEGLSVAEVAERLHVTSQQVWFRQCRGKKQFDRLFRKYYVPAIGKWLSTTQTD